MVTVVVLDRRAGTHEVPVTLRIVDATDGRPELARPRPWGGKGALFAGVGVLPVAGRDGLGRVRRMLERVVVARQLALFDGAYLLSNGDHGVAEPVEFGLRLAFGRLHHQGPGDGKAHRRSMEAVIHEPLGDVVHL